VANRNYDGIQHLKKKGDVFQWGGAWLCEGGVCPTADGRGNLIPIELPELRKAEGQFFVTTRRGKQFNSMVYSEKDPFNAADRYDILMNREDAVKLGIREGESIVAYNRFGMMQGRAKFADVKTGNIAVYWPEGNVLIPKGIYETYAQIPDYNTTAIVEKAETFHAQKDRKYVEKRIEELEMSVD
jgi:anaerobic selenocysteine-containing dehydrogenase